MAHSFIEGVDKAMKKYPENITVVEEFALTIKQERKRARMNRLSSVLVLAALAILFSIFAPGFCTIGNLVSILKQIAIPLVLAVGVTFVVIIGSIDLSIEGLMALAGTMTAWMMLNRTNSNDFGVWAIVIVLVGGGIIGALIGLVQVKTKIPSFLLTYAISSILMGVTLLVYKGKMVQIEEESFLMIAKSSFLGIPVLTWIAAVVFIIALILQEYTPFGRYIYAIGSNENVPKSNGININKIKIIVFAISGLCIAIAGVMGASRIAYGDVSIGTGNLFPTLTAIVLGGTAMSGGRGGVVNTLIGVVIVAVLDNGLILIGCDPVIITGIQGLIILAAVALSVDRSGKEINK